MKNWSFLLNGISLRRLFLTLLKKDTVQGTPPSRKGLQKLPFCGGVEKNRMK